MTDRERLGAVVAKIREARGWSVAEFAERLCVSADDVELLESGFQQGLGITTIAKALDLPKQILAVLAIDPSELSGVDRKITESFITLAWTLVVPEEKAA